MAKARNPITVSGEFGVKETHLADLGVLDATLAIDTKLFIDPLLLRCSKHSEFKVSGVQQYRGHFEQIIRLLANSRSENDPAWKAAYKMFDFPEIEGTCLGYGAGSIHGRAWGPILRTRVFRVAAQIIEIGVRDPDLFSALALFEADIGPDRISDMTTNIVFGALSTFNARVLGRLGLKGEIFIHREIKAQFLVNPYEKKRVPIILVPTDILKDLPIAHDWDSVATAARGNEELRDRVNQYISSIWVKKTRRDKCKLKVESLSSKDAFETLLKAIKTVNAQAYDVAADPEGLILWATKARQYANQFPLNLGQCKVTTLTDVFSVVQMIVKQFRHLIEHNGLNKELYRSKKKPRHESTAQRLFFAVAYSYCEANNIGVSPEIDTGNGKIDFQFSAGFGERVLVEVKLSTNQNVVSGYKTQLEIYKASQQTMKAIYLLIDVGSMGRKAEDLVRLRNDSQKQGVPLSELEFVDGTVKLSARAVLI